ncbi:MAG: flagellar protein FlbB [Hyphomicrobiales bacterium]|nr:flagellar protein FlbB [Hyphomicrobiales bacterium]
MIHQLREIRLLPLVLFATVALLALKTVGLLIAGHYMLNDTQPEITGDITRSIDGMPRSGGKQSWAQEVLGYPETSTGSVPSKSAEKTAEQKAAPKTSEPTDKRGWKTVPLDATRQSPSEIAILERLQERRTELDNRTKELEMRENLIKATEKRLEGRISELKDLETRVSSGAQQREEGEAARFKNVVTMYENMKAKDAAKIFDRLELKILVEVATQINPRRMSDILAQMSPDAAERLTVELAARSKDRSPELPKIEGRPGPN